MLSLTLPSAEEVDFLTPHAEPKALGMDVTAWVALAMLVVIALLLWKKVPAAIGKALDNKQSCHCA